MILEESKDLEHDKEEEFSEQEWGVRRDDTQEMVWGIIQALQ